MLVLKLNHVNKGSQMYIIWDMSTQCAISFLKNNIKCKVYLQQRTPASSLWLQSVYLHGSCSHNASSVSLPVHCTLSSNIDPCPEPNSSFLVASPPSEYPNCLQTTMASRWSHISSQTVPHSPSYCICTVPSPGCEPPMSVTGDSINEE